MPPTSIDGTDITGATIDGTDVQEITVDGDTVFTAAIAIPDSEANQKLIHRWVLDDVNGTVVDSEGSANGTNNGVTSVNGNYAGGSAGQGDGTNDYIETTTLGSFGSSVMDGDFAVAYTLDDFTSSDFSSVMGVLNNSDNTYMDIPLNDSTTGEVGINLRSQGTNSFYRAESSGASVNDGGEYRVVVNKIGSGPADAEFYINQSGVSTSVISSGFGTPTDFDFPVQLFARNNRGQTNNNLAGVIDDICIFNDSLTQPEVNSYQNPWE